MPEALSGQNSQAALCRRHNLSTDQLSKWKHQLLENAATLFESTHPQSNASTERIAELEQRVDRLTLGLEIHKKALKLLSEDNKGVVGIDAFLFSSVLV